MNHVRFKTCRHLLYNIVFANFAYGFAMMNYNILFVFGQLGDIKVTIFCKCFQVLSCSIHRSQITGVFISSMLWVYVI